MCFVWISEQTAAFALYNTNRLVFKTNVEYLLRGTHAQSPYTKYRLRLKSSADSFLTNLMYQMPKLIQRFVCSTCISTWHRTSAILHRLFSNISTRHALPECYITSTLYI